MKAAIMRDESGKLWYLLDVGDVTATVIDGNDSKLVRMPAHRIIGWKLEGWA